MFEYLLSPDGHFGLMNEGGRQEASHKQEVSCATCGAVYELLDRVDASRQPVKNRILEEGS
jgi:hypothetical protein